MKAMRGFMLSLAALGAAGAAAAPFDLVARLEAAPPGAVIEVPAGRHAGPFVVRKPVTLRGATGAILEGNGQGHVVDVHVAEVEISGFVIRGSGSNLSTDDAGIHVRAPRAVIRGNTIVDTLHGVYLRAASDCRVEDNIIRGRAAAATIGDPLTQGLRLSSAELCSVELGQDRRGNGIHAWKCRGQTIAGNDIRDTRDGIYFSFCDDSVIRDNRIARTRYGLHYMYSDGNVFAGNVFSENAAGAALMYSHGIRLTANRFVANRSHRAYGLLMHTVETTVAEGNEILGNTVGAFLENSTANVFLGNRLAGNYIALRLSESSDENRFSRNAFGGNVHPVETAGRTGRNCWAVAGVGNYWDNALGLDLDADGLADVPHRESDLFGRWREEFPEIGLLSGSPGERALRFLHARLNLPGFPGVTDPAPLRRAEAR